MNATEKRQLYQSLYSPRLQAADLSALVREFAPTGDFNVIRNSERLFTFSCVKQALHLLFEHIIFEESRHPTGSEFQTALQSVHAGLADLGIEIRFQALERVYSVYWVEYLYKDELVVVEFDTALYTC